MALDPSDIVTLSRLLDEVLALPDAEHGAWLAALPAAHARHADTLREMLAQHARPDMAVKLPTLPPQGSDDTVALPGERVGPYRLLREIGRGGMGSVWLAEQADGRMRRQVALKLPRLAWGAGLAERMARERDIAALLEHPGIARLYDAGVDERGRPYLALEYIDGQPIDAWCAAQHLGVRERLRLALQLVRALAYAHGRLVVHRDIKPSNVLVSADGQTHLLDFGIAKLLDVERAEASVLTQFGRVMTPHYASPEQVAGQVVTVQSDVYSLGVLLYELLCGARPIAPKRDSLGAVEEAILAGDVPPASSRSRDPATARALRGDVDAILAKALHRDPARRYATMDAFGEDIERHLAGARVQARRASLAYRCAVVLRRHRLAFTAGAVAALALLAGTAVALRQAQRALDEATRARLVREFVVDIFAARNEQQEGALGQMTARALLERSAGRVDPMFAGQPAIQAELHGVMSSLLYNISENEQAAEAGIRQLRALRAAQASGDAIAQAALSLAAVLIPLERNREVLDYAGQALQQPGASHGLRARAHGLRAVGWLFGWSDTVRAAEELDAADALLPRAAISTIDRAGLLYARGLWYAFNEDNGAARQRFEACIELALAAEGANSRQALHCRHEAIKVLIWSGELDAGRAQLAKALATMRAAGGPDDVQAAHWESMATGWLFFDDGLPFKDAMAVHERCLRIMQRQSWAQAGLFADAVREDMARTLMRWGDYTRAWAVMPPPDAPALQGDATAAWHRLRVRARRLMVTERAAEAPPMARQLLALDRPWGAGDDLRHSYETLALTLIHVRRYAEAEAALREFETHPLVVAGQVKARTGPSEAALLAALALGQPERVLALTAGLKPAPAVHADEVAWLSRAEALCASGRREEGLALFDVWLPRLATERYEAYPQLFHWRARMGLCALDAGRPTQARRAWAQAHAAAARQPLVSPHLLAPVRELGRRLGRPLALAPLPHEPA